MAMTTKAGGGRRTALVTGAATGIGAETARRLGRDGVQIALLGIDGQAAEMRAVAAEIGTNTLVLEADVRDGGAVSRAVKSCAAELGPVDVLVNSAGVSSDSAAVELDEETWDRVLDTNLKGTFLLCRACAPGMVERGWGRIVNLASVFGIVGFPNRAAYASSKGGVAALTRALAIEWAQSGVTVNAVAPGLIETAMSAGRLADPDYRQATLGVTPNRRIGQPEDVAEAIAFLASERALHITGQVIAVDGGFTVA